MPVKTYMVVDDRRDHSLRIPRPDLSDELGTPNACTQCHTKPRGNQRLGGEGDSRMVRRQAARRSALRTDAAAARQGNPEAVDMIRELLDGPERPDIVRATAIQLLGQYGTPESDKICRQHMDDSSPLVRRRRRRRFLKRR